MTERTHVSKRANAIFAMGACHGLKVATKDWMGWPDKVNIVVHFLNQNILHMNFPHQI